MTEGKRQLRRHSLHRYMTPRGSCDTCYGRGYYETDPDGPDAGLDRFCGCAAGALRRRVDAGETVLVDWPEEPSDD